MSTCPECGGEMEHTHGDFSDFVCSQCGYPDYRLMKQTEADRDLIAKAEKEDS